MYKTDFLEFYNNVVKELGVRFETEYKQFHFCDNPNSLYEEYLNQKTILRVLYEKNDGEEKALLDRHKVCACMLTAIIKVRLVSGDIESDDSFTLSMASRIASYGKTGQLLRVSGAAVPFRTVRSTAMLARSATGEVNTVIYLYPAC